MIIFAWILWGLLLLYGCIRAILVIAKAMSDPQPNIYDENYSPIEKIDINIRPVNSLLKIACFVFLTLYLFL